MAEVSMKFDNYIESKKLNKRDAARQLGVCLASFYKYLAKETLPGIAVLRRANKKWHLKFKYAAYNLDDDFFESVPDDSAPVRETQIALPFIEALREEDIEILEVIPKKPNAIEVRLRIQFAAS